METALPRLLYHADVPVCSSLAGAALIYRLLLNYPVDRLLIVENQPSPADQRIPLARYTNLPVR